MPAVFINSRTSGYLSNLLKRIVHQLQLDVLIYLSTVPPPGTGSALSALLTQPASAPVKNSSPPPLSVPQPLAPSGPLASKPPALKAEPKSRSPGSAGVGPPQNANAVPERGAAPKADPLSRFNFTEDSNSPKPTLPSQKPAPPGATVCKWKPYWVVVVVDVLSIALLRSHAK